MYPTSTETKTSTSNFYSPVSQYCMNCVENVKKKILSPIPNNNSSNMNNNNNNTKNTMLLPSSSISTSSSSCCLFFQKKSSSSFLRLRLLPLFNLLLPPRRYLMVFWLWSGIGISYIIRVSLSLAILPIQEQYAWSNITKGWILSTFYMGYIMGQIPFTTLATEYGMGKLIFGLGVLFPGLLCFFIPHILCGEWHCDNNGHIGHIGGVYGIGAIRMLMGLCQSCVFPVCVTILRKWVPEQERSFMIATTFTGYLAGTAIAFPLTGWIMHRNMNHDDDDMMNMNNNVNMNMNNVVVEEEELTFFSSFFSGWEGTFYVNGILCIVWYLGFISFVYETPETDAKISRTEKQYIIANRGKTNVNEKTHKIPLRVWKAFFSNRHCWAMYVTHFAHNWAVTTMVTYSPSYMTEKLGFDLQSTGIYSVVPYLSTLVIQLVASSCSDWIVNSISNSTAEKSFKKSQSQSQSQQKCKTMMSKVIQSKTHARSLFTALGTIIPSLLFLNLGYIDNHNVGFLVLVIAIASTSFLSCSYPPLAMDMTPRYSGIFYSISNTIGTIPGIVSPYLGGVILTTNSNKSEDGADGTDNEWQGIFMIMAIIYGIAFVVWFSCVKADIVKELNVCSDTDSDSELESDEDVNVNFNVKIDDKKINDIDFEQQGDEMNVDFDKEEEIDDDHFMKNAKKPLLP